MPAILCIIFIVVSLGAIALGLSWSEEKLNQRAHNHVEKRRISKQTF